MQEDARVGQEGLGEADPGPSLRHLGEERVGHQEPAQVRPEVIGEPARDDPGEEAGERGQKVPGIGPEGSGRPGREETDGVAEPGGGATVEQHVSAPAERVEVLRDGLVGEVPPGDGEVAGGAPVEDREAFDVSGPEAAEVVAGERRGSRFQLGPAGAAAGGERLQVHGVQGGGAPGPA